MKQAQALTVAKYCDPGHGWYKVPCKLIVELGIADEITGFSALSGTHAYLEEDHDASIFLKAAEAAGYTVRVKSNHTNQESRVRRYPTYGAQECRERGNRLKATAGIIAEFGGHSYTLVRSLGRKGWECEKDGVTYRMSMAQLSNARLRNP